MKKTQAEKRARELRNELHRHNRLYYVEAQPEISDREYDRLYRELTDIETAFPDLVTDDSPTHRIGGAPLSEFAHVTHTVRMMSLDNTYSRDELVGALGKLRGAVKVILAGLPYCHAHGQGRQEVLA